MLTRKVNTFKTLCCCILLHIFLFLPVCIFSPFNDDSPPCKVYFFWLTICQLFMSTCRQILHVNRPSTIYIAMFSAFQTHIHRFLCKSGYAGNSLYLPVLFSSYTYIHTLFEKSFLPTGSVKMFRNLSLTYFVII